MRTAFVTSSVSRDAGGLFFAMTSLAKSLHRNGVDLCTHGVLDANASEDGIPWQPVPCIAHSRRGPASLAYAPNMASALEAGGFDLVHTHGIWQWPSAAVHLWHKKAGKPYLISPHGMLDPWAVAQSRWKKRIISGLYESAHLRDAACIHALCQSEADSIRAYGLRNPIAIIPNGVDLSLEEPESLKIEGPRSRDRKILLFLGRLHRKKGLVNALRAWSEIRGQESGVRGQEEWQFVIAGWDQGRHEAELQRLCLEIGLGFGEVSVSEFLDQGLTSTAEWPGQGSLPQNSSDHRSRATQNGASVLFVGPAFGSQKDALLREASAFILPSFSEGLPMSVLEAWSYGLPVLMTDECNLPEGFAANAALRIGTDVVRIAEGLRLLFESPISDLRSLGDNGRLLVSERFSWPMIAAQVKQVYEWILGGGVAPDCVRK